MSDPLLDFARTYLPHKAADLTYETPLIDEGLLDSLMLMQLIAFLEARYGATIPPEDVTPQNFGNFCAIETLMKRLTAPSHKSN